MKLITGSRIRDQILCELIRLVAIGSAVTWILHPYMTSRQVGSGDSLWYASALSDFIEQTKAGVFPVLIGQSSWAFNGAVSPIRIIPLYQHIGGALDFLTLHSLSAFALQNFCLVVCGFAAAFAMYFGLVAVAPRLRWSAAALASMYFSCPGVLGTLFSQDLLATWVAVPFVAIATSAILATLQKGHRCSEIWLAGSLAALWWAHTPLAVWVFAFALFSQCFRLFRDRKESGVWSRALLAGVVFVILAIYPFASALSLNASERLTNPILGSFKINDLLGTIHSSFPGSLLPVSTRATNPLSDLQLGYGLWGFLFLGFFLVALRPKHIRASPVVVVLGIGCFILVSLLLPIPGWTAFIWHLVPKSVLVMTNQWPMQRFYLILAAFAVLLSQLAFDWMKPIGPRSKLAATMGITLACGWSLWQARQFRYEAEDRTSTVAASELAARPENAMLSIYSYGGFSSIPDYFSNGVMDPSEEVRLLRRGDQKIESRGRVVPVRWLTGELDANPGILDLSPKIHLEPNSHYQLILDFPASKYSGVLQIHGKFVSHEYALPQSGNKLAFGSGPSQSHKLPLWTTSDEGDDVQLRFIPDANSPKPLSFSNFSRYLLINSSENNPIHVHALIPFEAKVEVTVPSWLETPRMFVPGYLATVDGVPVNVEPSLQRLAQIAIGPGMHEVRMWYAGPLFLRASYWLALLSWAAFLSFSAIRIVISFLSWMRFGEAKEASQCRIEDSLRGGSSKSDGCA